MKKVIISKISEIESLSVDSLQETNGGGKYCARSVNETFSGWTG
jgi:hypothetical protein